MVEDVEAVVTRLLDDLGMVPPWYDDNLVRDEVDPDATTVFYNSEGRRLAMGSLGNMRAMARVVRELRHIAPVLPLMATAPGPGVITQFLVCIQVAERNCLAAVKARLAQAPTEHAAAVLDMMMQEHSR